MRRKKDKNQQEEINFWQSQSDLLTALVLILLLIILLLSLYLMQIPDTEYKDMWVGDDVKSGELELTPTPTPTDTPTPTPTLSPTPTPVPRINGGNGGGDDGGRDENEGSFEGEGEKSAVYVMLVDGDTDLTVKEKGIQFELHERQGNLMTLNTYYPERISYRNYETTEDGVFYLPEKIHQGQYYLKELTEPAGYDLPEEEYFNLSEYYDWDDPYTVRVPVYPSRNIIKVQMLDRATGQTLEGGSFRVIAASNILTQDGTLRYRKGETASEIICDENGYGESGELYLGSYILKQQEIPEYYAGLDESEMEIEVEKKTNVEALPNLLESDRTEFILELKDELYENQTIQGAEFSITAGRRGVADTYKTDSRGTIYLDELSKDTTYYVKQTASVGDYYPDETVYQVHVSADGHIEGESSYTLSLTNWILRISVGVEDSILHTQISDVNVALYDENDVLVRSWTTAGNPIELSNVKTGKYYVVLDGNNGKKYGFTVVNTKEIQKVAVTVDSTLGKLVLAVIILVLLLVGGGTLAIVLRRKRKKQ